MIGLGILEILIVLLVMFVLWWPVIVGVFVAFRAHWLRLASLNIDPVRCIRYETANPRVTYSPTRLLNACVLLMLPLVPLLLAAMIAAGPLFGLGLVLIAGVGAWRLWPLARRRWQASAKEALRRDTRNPVLLLRSFQDDLVKLKPPWYRLKRRAVFFEELLTGQLWCLGPVIAIGRPGEALPPVGAARDYFTDDSWQREAERMVVASQSIVMIVGTTEGLGWEIRRIHDLKMLSKLALAFPPIAPGESNDRWSRFCWLIEKEEFAAAMSAAPAERLVLVLFPKEREPIALTVRERRDPQAYQLAMAAALQLLIPAPER